MDSNHSSPLKSNNKMSANVSPVKGGGKSTILGHPIELIKDKLYWVSDAKPPQNYKNAFFFNID